jgi:hypothetical protein
MLILLCNWGVTTAVPLTSTSPVRLRKALLDRTLSVGIWFFGLYLGQSKASQQDVDNGMYYPLRFGEATIDYSYSDSRIPGISSNVRPEKQH